MEYKGKLHEDSTEINKGDRENLAGFSVEGGNDEERGSNAIGNFQFCELRNPEGQTSLSPDPTILEDIKQISDTPSYDDSISSKAGSYVVVSINGTRPYEERFPR